MTHCYVELAEELLCAGADPNVKDISLHNDVTSTYRTICHDVSESGSFDTLKTLLKYGADINLKDKTGNTPTHLAAKGGHFQIVQYLLCGMSPASLNLLLHSPLDYLDNAEEPVCRQWVERRKSENNIFLLSTSSVVE